MSDYRQIQQQQPPNLSKTRNLAEMARGMLDWIYVKENEDGMEQSQVYKGSKYKKPVFMVNDMPSTFLTMNKSLEYVGDNSTFQKRITWILVIQWVSFSFMVNSMAYFFRSPHFLCKVPLTGLYYSCSQSIACKMNQNQFKLQEKDERLFGNSQISIVQQFGLQCNTVDVYHAQSLFFLGGLISGYLFSYISQRIGRRPVILTVILLSIISMLLCAWAPNFHIFTTSYFFIGSFLFGYQTKIYIYIGEISAMRFKTININMLTMVWAGTPFFMPLLSLISTWRICFLLFAGIWTITLPFSYFCFLQSPRFLLSKKCYSQVRQIFQKISITNRRPPYKFRLTQQIDVQNQTFLRLRDNKQPKQQSLRNTLLMQETQVIRQYNYFDLFRYPSLKRPTFILMYLWMFRFFMYFGLNLALQSVLKSGYLLTVAISSSSISEVIGSFGIPLMTFFSSKKYKIDIIKYCLLLISLCCAIMWMIQLDSDCQSFQYQNKICYKSILMIILVNLIKFFNSIFFSGIITYSSEVYPTVVRSLGYGFTITFGRVGTIIVPFYINYMRTEYYNINSVSFLAPFGILAYLFCKLMPICQLQGMKETIPEEDKDSRVNRKVIQMAEIVKNPAFNTSMRMQINQLIK